VPRYLLAAFVPVTLLFSLALFFALWTNSPWQVPITGAGDFLCLVIPSLLAGEIVSTELPMAAAPLAVLVIGAWGAGTLALAHGLIWLLAWAPAAYLLLASTLWTRGRLQSPAQRLSVWVATALLIAVIYLADLTGLWWGLIVASLLSLAALGLLLWRFPLRRRYMQARAVFVLYAMTALAVLIALAVGGLEAALPQQARGIAAASVTTVIAAAVTRQSLLHTRLALWAAVICLMLPVVGIAILMQHGAWWEVLAACGALLLALSAAVLARKVPQSWTRSP
jgi:hypothetical protein